jgi:serine/threonine protein kinase
MTTTHRYALPNGYELGGYRIDGILGTGGFGITYRASEVAIDRALAIKEYLPAGIAMRDQSTSAVHASGSSDQDDFEWGLDRFRKEAQTLVSFRHANIVAVFRFFEANNTAYLVMEYARGENLGDILVRQKTLTEAEIYALVEPLLNGLSRVHQAGVLHRDIKPDNIYIREDGSPLLLDFGAARYAMGVRSHSLTSIVSAGYAPFEQYISNSKQGPWSDIYALGAVLYRAVTGNIPPEATARVKDDELLAASQAARGRYSERLLKAIDAALSVDEKDRPQSIADLIEMLGIGASSEGQTIQAERVPARSQLTDSETKRLSITADDLNHAKRHLAEAIGPIAGVLVKKAALEAADLSALYLDLAENISDPQDRERFLASRRASRRI